MDSLKWAQIFERFFAKLTPAYEMKFADGRILKKKGKIATICIKIQRRTSNKKITLVDNLNVFGIDPEIFAHQVQLGVCCSTSLNEAGPGCEGPQVQIQGNQAIFLERLLCETYGVPKKFITGLDIALKETKKK